jgi:hypothetical protein
MASVVDVCNLALSHIGKYHIASLQDARKEALECRTLYPRARNSTLRDFDWNFARKRIILAQLVDTFAGWDYAYQYPTDCLRALQIFNTASDSAVDQIPFEIGVNEGLSGRVILTDQEEAILIYTAAVEDPNVFDDVFIDALSYRLAADLALPLRGDPQVQQAMLNIYGSLLGRAQATNANERHKTPDDANYFVDARS